MRKGKLNDKQAAFVREYVKDWNGAQAAIRAGYSSKTARQIAAELLTKPVVQAAVEAAGADSAKRNEITVDEILQGLKSLAFPENGAIFPRDRIKAMELLGRHLGMFVDRREVSGPGGKAIEVNAKTWLDVMEMDDGSETP